MKKIITNKFGVDRASRILLRLMLILTIAALPSLVKATNLSVDVGTGGDDLRGGNAVYIRVTLLSGVTTAERVLSKGLPQDSTLLFIQVAFSETFTANQIRSIRIRHDGNPRSGQPFDTYDNWDLKSLTISLGPSRIYDSANDSLFFFKKVIQFTGDFRVQEFVVNRTAAEADFAITRIIGSSIIGNIRVTVQNLSGASGIIQNITCFNETENRSYSANPMSNLLGLSQIEFNIRFRYSGGRVTCNVKAGPGSETLTQNNVFSVRTP